MTIDRKQLLSLESNGIFTTGDDYQKWLAWKNKLMAAFYTARAKHSSLLSSTIPIEYLYDTLKLCEGRTEDAMNAFVGDMLKNGASWEHLTVLAILSGDEYRSIVPKSHAGRYKCQIADWLMWTSGIELSASNLEG